MNRIWITVCFLIFSIIFIAVNTRMEDQKRLVCYYSSVMDVDSWDFILRMNRNGYHLVNIIPSEKNDDMIYIFEKD